MCPALLELGNGNVVYSGDTDGVAPYEIGSNATFSCNAGYSLVGDKVRTCVEGTDTGGEWSGQPSNCERE